MIVRFLRTAFYGLLMVPAIVLMFGAFQPLHAEKGNEGLENRLLMAQLTRFEPRPEPSIMGEEKVTAPAVREPSTRATQEHVTVEKEEISPDKKDVPPRVKRPDRATPKKEPTPKTVQPPPGEQPPPPATIPQAIQRPQLELEPSRPREAVTLPDIEQKPSPPGLPARPEPGVVPPPPAFKQPRFGLPPQQKEDVVTEKPEDPQSPVGVQFPPGIPERVPQWYKTEDLPKFRKAEIISLEIGTKDNGQWIWKATVKNTGHADLDGSDLILQGYSRPVDNGWKPASGSIVGNQSISPNQSLEVTHNWNRCCRTYALRIELRDRVSDNVLDYKGITHLVFDLENNKPLNVRISHLEYNQSSVTWNATIRNHTDYTAKIGIQGEIRSFSGQDLPAGSGVFTLGPQATLTTNDFDAGSVTTGAGSDRLYARIWCIMGSDSCAETKDDCGAEVSNWMYLYEESKDF